LSEARPSGCQRWEAGEVVRWEQGPGGGVGELRGGIGAGGRCARWLERGWWSVCVRWRGAVVLAGASQGRGCGSSCGEEAQRGCLAAAAWGLAMSGAGAAVVVAAGSERRGRWLRAAVS
jgi:hypothetical protein